MIILSNEDGLFKVGNIEKSVAFMEGIYIKSNGEFMKPEDWLLQEVSSRAFLRRRNEFLSNSKR